MFPFRCISPECQTHGRSDIMFWLPSRERDAARAKECGGTDPQHVCPNCESGMYLDRCEVIHWLIHDPNGLVRGSDYSPFRGTIGNAFSPACERGQDVLRKGGRLRYMTSLPSAATCFECVARRESSKHLGYAESGLFVPGACNELVG